jgi:2-iminobutanoate/2-iminopropanoate deaminase
MQNEKLISDALPAPIGPFSHAVRAGEFVFLSGQVGQDPATGKLAEGGVAAQARQAFANIAQVLKTAGKSFDDVVKVNVFLADMADFASMNEVYAQTFKKPYPARTTVAVAGLPMGARVEIELSAR